MMTDQARPRVPSCPLCGAAITLSAVFDSDTPGQPEAPAFWGLPGRRFIKCMEGAWVHFQVADDQGQRTDRIAYLKGRARPGDEARRFPQLEEQGQ